MTGATGEAKERFHAYLRAASALGVSVSEMAQTTFRSERTVTRALYALGLRRPPGRGAFRKLPPDDVLEIVGGVYTEATIAKVCGVSQPTVHRHLKRIFGENPRSSKKESDVKGCRTVIETLTEGRDDVAITLENPALEEEEAQ